MPDVITDERIREGSELCTSCGLCGHGIMEKAAVLEPEEVELARDLGLKHPATSDGIDKLFLPQCSYEKAVERLPSHHE